METQTDKQHIKSIWGVLKRLCYNVVYMLDNLVPIFAYVCVALISIMAYANSIHEGEAKAICPNSILSGVTFSVLWLSIRAAYKQLKTLK